MILALPIISLYSREVEQQNSRLYQQTMAHQMEQADVQISSLLEQLQFFCGTDQNFLSLSNPSLKLDYLALHNLQGDLSNMLHGYSYVKDTVLLTRNDLIVKRSLSFPNRSMLIEIFFEKFFVVDGISTPDDLRALGQAFHCLSIADHDHGEYLALAVCRPLYNEYAQLVGHALVTVDLEKLLQDVVPAEFVGFADVRVRHAGQLLYELPCSKSVPQPVSLSVTSPRMGVEVEITLPKNLLHQSIRSILTAIWLLVGTALLGGLALTIVFLLITGRPIRRLTQAARAIAPAIQAQNEYDYIEGTLSQLSRSMDQSREQIAAQRTMLQQTVLEKAMMGGLTAQKEFAMLFPDFPERYQIALVQMPVSDDAESAIDLALSERLMLEHLLSDQFTQMLYFLHISAGMAALVLPELPGHVEALEALREAFFSRYQLPVNIFLGDSVSGENMLSEAYASAKYIQGCASAYIEKRVWHRGNFPSQTSISNIDYTVFQPLYEALFDGRKEKALECLAHLRATLPTPSGTAYANRRTLEFAHSILIRVKQERFEVLSNISLPFPDLHGTLNECMRTMEENIIRLCDAIIQSNPQTTSFSREIVAWVDENFADPDLYLKSVTVHFKINEKTLQAAMHEVTGTSFAEYLENKRLTRAAQLLNTTRQNVKEIGRQSGFALYNTFYKSFKRRYGCSPLEYRAQRMG